MSKLKPGPVYSIVTPFQKDLSIDFEKLEEYINYAYDAVQNNFM
jgi:dihydrodipicolinate synthase/N-acetylneuraminate lyase